jgi:putative flippase GtrA
MLHCIYCKYFVIGSIVGIIAIAAREILVILLPSDTPAYYLLSVALVYAGGIIGSFYAHYRITFSHIRHKRAAFESIGKFTVIAIIGMIVTSLLSYQIRYHLGLQPVFSTFLPAFAFGTATVIASLVTYSLNKKYTFVTSGPLAGTGKQDNGKEQPCP